MLFLPWTLTSSVSFLLFFLVYCLYSLTLPERAPLPVNRTPTHVGSFMLYWSWFISHHMNHEVRSFGNSTLVPATIMSCSKWVSLWMFSLLLPILSTLLKSCSEFVKMQMCSTPHLPSNLPMAFYRPWYEDQLVFHKMRPYVWYLYTLLGSSALSLSHHTNPETQFSNLLHSF